MTLDTAQQTGQHWMQNAAAGFFDQVHELAVPAVNDVSAVASSSPIAARALKEIALLGHRTAQMHLELASRGADTFTANDLAADSMRLRTQIVTTLDELKLRLAAIPAPWIDHAASLIGLRKHMLEQSSALAIASAYRCGRRIPIHGNLQLNQVLLISDAFIITASDSPQHHKQSPLRDVATMLCSFRHAAILAYNAHKLRHNTSPDTWAMLWNRATSTAFLHSYRATMEVHPELLPHPEQSVLFLRAFMLERVLCELHADLNH